MSDKSYGVILPARTKEPSRYADGITRDPEEYQIKLIDEIRLSGIASGLSLGLFQDEISKQVFWCEWENFYGEVYPEYLEENYGLWVISPDKSIQMQHFILGWAPHYYSYDIKERKQMNDALDEALEASPTDDVIDAWYRFIRYKERPWVEIPWAKHIEQRKT